MRHSAARAGAERGSRLGGGADGVGGGVTGSGTSFSGSPDATGKGVYGRRSESSASHPLWTRVAHTGSQRAHLYPQRLRRRKAEAPSAEEPTADEFAGDAVNADDARMLAGHAFRWTGHDPSGDQGNDARGPTPTPRNARALPGKSRRIVRRGNFRML